MTGRRLLFVKRRLAYPRSSGHDVHTWELMRALQQRGHQIFFASLDPINPDAVAGLDLVESRELVATLPGDAPVALSRLQERFRSYWGIDRRVIGQVGRFEHDVQADAVVLSGLDLLPCLGGIRRAVRVWYAGDEWVRHHLSLMRLFSPDSWTNLKPAMVKGLYERAFAGAADRVWVVSDDERRAVERVMRKPHVDVVPNGVDVAHFAPTGAAEKRFSACFWGRLDFEPNIDAVTWFCHQVWPRLLGSETGATLTVYGFQPTAAVERLCATTPGVRLVPNLPDLRREIEAHGVVVLPFVSGGGIKNKLLEAAALARPIVASPLACQGLQATAPIIRATGTDEWIAAILGLWRSEERRRELGTAARTWVSEHHSWKNAARQAASGIEMSIRKSPLT